MERNGAVEIEIGRAVWSEEWEKQWKNSKKDIFGIRRLLFF